MMWKCFELTLVLTLSLLYTVMSAVLMEEAILYSSVTLPMDLSR